MADRFGLADVWMRLGHMARLRGEWEQAVAVYQRSLRVSVEMGSTAGVPETLEGLTAAWQGRGETERALQLWVLAQTLRTRTGVGRAPYNEAWVVPLLDVLQAEAHLQRWDLARTEIESWSVAQLREKIPEALSP